MITGVEIDMVVPDSIKALELYEKIFALQVVEATAFEKGSNEAVFTLFGVRFHLLDENAPYQMVAPRPGDPTPMWLNVAVPDIRETYNKAVNAGCEVIQTVTENADFGVCNAMFRDPFGYVWMLHQVDKVVSFEERCRILREEMGESQ